jgi:hypothetical protein
MSFSFLLVKLFTKLLVKKQPKSGVIIAKSVGFLYFFPPQLKGNYEYP